MHNLEETTHNETEKTIQVRYCANTMCSTEVTLDKRCKNTIQERYLETKHHSCHGIM